MPVSAPSALGVFASFVEQRLFCWNGGESPLALSKERKEELVAKYESWLQESEAIFLTEYSGRNKYA